MKKSLFNLLAVFVITVNGFAQEATFESLGILVGNQSMAHAVSADGTYVVGESTSSLGPMSGTEAFRWNESEGIVGLGDLPGGVFTSFARGISSDGNIIVGTGWGDGFTEALRWENNVMEGIGFLPGGTDSFAYAVSDDGLTIVGYGFNSMGSSEAFRWTQENGIEGLGFLSGEAESTGFDISGDGSVIVGYAMRSDGFYEAFRWIETGGMEGLGDLPGGDFDSHAWGVSSDGSTIVGWSSTGPVDYEAFRWTEADGMVSIGDLPGGGTFGMARATSADGSVIVGEGLIEGGSVAFYWTQTEGMRNLKEMLENDYGLDLQGWTLSYASSVSDDGRTVVGYAVNPSGQTEAYRVVLPEATSCQAPGSFFLDEVTESTASFSWNPSPSEVSGYNWFVMNFGDSPDMDDPVAGGTTLSWMTWATATDLTPDTMYHVYLQTSCDGGEQSDYAGPFMITTICGGGECIQPSDIAVSTVTDSVVFVSWTENGSATQWEIEYGESGFPQGEGTVIVDNDGMPGEAISGLEEGIDYDVYIRAICEFSESDWEGPVTFNTKEMGINELGNQMILYPNPTTGIINLQTKEPIKAVSVYNLTGQKMSVSSLNKENTSIDISNLSSGIYFVEVILNDKTIKRHKVIKK